METRNFREVNLIVKIVVFTILIALFATMFSGCVKNYGEFSLPVDSEETGEKITELEDAIAAVNGLKDKTNFAIDISANNTREWVNNYAVICYAEDVLYIMSQKSEGIASLPERQIELLYYETEKGVKYRKLFYDNYQGEKDSSEDIKTVLEEDTSYLLCLELVSQYCKAENWNETEQRFVAYDGEDIAWSLEVYTDQICLKVNQKLIEFEEFDFFSAWQNNTITFYGFDQVKIEKPVKPWYSFT